MFTALLPWLYSRHQMLSGVLSWVTSAILNASASQGWGGDRATSQTQGFPNAAPNGQGLDLPSAFSS